MTVGQSQIHFRVPGPMRPTKIGRGIDEELARRTFREVEQQWLSAEDLLRKIGAEYHGGRRMSGHVRELAKRLGFRIRHDYRHHDGNGETLRVRIVRL